VHIGATLIILVATVVGLLGVAKVQGEQLMYSLMFLGCGVMLALSHNLKESIIRTQPLDMTNFNFKVSVAQLVVVVLTTPLVMLFCKRYERFTLPSMIAAQQQPAFL